MMIKMIETDKSSRDVRRGTNRFSRQQIKQSGTAGVGGGGGGGGGGGVKLISGLNGDFLPLEKSTKERIKKLSAVNREISINDEDEENYEMGCEVADRVQQAPSSISSNGGHTHSKRFKLPRKQFLDDCNGVVDHVSVPRKLRSAKKKRNRESISPPLPNSKKLNHSNGGIESPKRIGVKKSKLNQKQGAPSCCWSFKERAGGPITKDEEEVVETLYALAGMFPDNEPDSNNKLDRASLEASSSAGREASEGQPPKLEDSVAVKEDLNAIYPSRIDEQQVDHVPDIEKLPEETDKFSSLNEPRVQEQSNFPSSEKLHGELHSSVAHVNLHKELVIHDEKMPPSIPVNFGFLSGPHQDTNSFNQPAKLEISLLDRKPDNALGQSTTIGRELVQQHSITESKNNGPSLWPGLASTVSTTGSHSPLSQSCAAAKAPAWLGTRPGLPQNGSSGKVFKVSTDRRSWKRCTAHVYISRLIRALQTSDGQESLPAPQNQMRPQEILKQGVLMTLNDFNGSSSLNGVTSASTIVNPAEENSNNNKIGNLQHLRPKQDNSQAAVASGMYSSHKQSFNFLSLSSGSGAMEPNHSFNGAGNGLEPLAQLQVPYHAQHPTLVPFSMSQTRYTSGYTNQPSAAQQGQLQLPPHLSNPANPYCVPHVNPKAMTRQQQQQQQQQQRLWAAQLAAQYRNNGTSTAMPQFPSWQNGRQDTAMMMQCMPSPSPSPSTLEVLGPKYPQITQHQQQQFMAMALPDARAKRQEHRIPSVYEENGVGFRSGGGLLPMQLLCNERL